MAGVEEEMEGDVLDGHGLGPWLVAIRRWLPLVEKVGVSGKEVVRGDSHSSSRRERKEPVDLVGGRLDGAPDAKGWPKLAKIAGLPLLGLQHP